VHQPVLFVEVDGLYVKHQRRRKKGKEVKIAAVHQGWEVNGERVRLKNKRHFIHDGKEPFWEAFEEFLMETFDDDPTDHKLVINGDGASWITACREYFKIALFFRDLCITSASFTTYSYPSCLGDNKFNIVLTIDTSYDKNIKN